MGVDKFLDLDQEAQKQTTVVFENPEHEDVTPGDIPSGKMKDHFEAADTIKNSKINRQLIVGEFMDALVEFMETEDEKALEDFFDELTE